ncbi:hypothetical protein A6A19_03400 [Actinobacillus delphinicola]|uniref:Predicted membrane protein n=1 Tax=Actinobacillus delphinicola TaxID=51161 RepID=A0A448TS72_9PAST|nr:hypothetical protein [Actinobacillus delphinicola]MDG6897070.1 hypothetical protein [Actinobacillus delphinicola]VEJ08884.1 Predicted membrane protein [Actinobacillus delphinicola]
MENQVITESSEHNQQIMQNNRMWMIAMYICFIGGMTILPGIAAIAGLIIAYVKRDDVRDTIYYSHCNWLIKTFWYPFFIAICAFIVVAIGMVIPYVGIILAICAYLVLFVISIWYIVRVIYGFIKLLNDQSVNADSWLL